MTHGPRVRELEDGRYLLEFEILDSTQSEARRRRQAGEERLAGVIAAYQRHGRGRRGSVWYAPPKQALLVSYLVPDDDTLQGVAFLSLAAGVAVAMALERLTRLPTKVRWPNDVLMNGRKVCGILVERFLVRDWGSLPRSFAAVGIGVNVNIVQFPERLTDQATSMKLVTSRDWSIEHVELAVRTALFPLLTHLRKAGRDYILRLWRTMDATPNTLYQTPLDREVVTGRGLAVTDKGALLIRLPDGRELEVTNARHCPVSPKVLQQGTKATGEPTTGSETVAREASERMPKPGRGG